MENEKIISLINLEVNKKSKIKNITNSFGTNFKRLKVLGFENGKEIEIIKFSPFRHSVIVCIENTYIAICEEIAKNVYVEEI